MATITMRAMLEAGAHFGHQTHRWNPRMRPYIFGARNGIHIVDLALTKKMASEAYDCVRDLVANGESILFVGTKKQACDVVREEAERCGMFYCTQRWLGGMLTNFQTIRASLKRLHRLETQLANEEEMAGLKKKEIARIVKERDKLEKTLGGIKEMDRLPAAIFIVDTRKESIAIAEAQRLGLASIAIVDTNCDPQAVNFPIPANDDAIRSIRLFSSFIADAVLDGKAQRSEGSEVPEASAAESMTTEPADAAAAVVMDPTAVIPATTVTTVPVAAPETAEPKAAASEIAVPVAAPEATVPHTPTPGAAEPAADPAAE